MNVNLEASTARQNTSQNALSRLLTQLVIIKVDPQSAQILLYIAHTAIICPTNTHSIITFSKHYYALVKRNTKDTLKTSIWIYQGV